MLLRCFWKSLLCVLRCLQKILLVSSFFFSACSMLSSLVESLDTRGLLPFSGVMRTVPVSKSMSVHLSM